MSDYSPTLLLGEYEVRNFFTPPLDYDDVTTAEILLKIESVEKYIEVVYNLTDSDARVPALLLVASRIVENPALASKYHQISSEKLGDYSYTLSNVASTSSKYSDLAATWKSMAVEMLEALAFGDKTAIWRFEKVND